MSSSVNLPSKYSNLKHVRKSKLDEFKRLCEDWKARQNAIQMLERKGLGTTLWAQDNAKKIKAIESRLDACMK